MKLARLSVAILLVFIGFSFVVLAAEEITRFSVAKGPQGTTVVATYSPWGNYWIDTDPEHDRTEFDHDNEVFYFFFAPRLKSGEVIVHDGDKQEHYVSFIWQKKEASAEKPASFIVTKKESLTTVAVKGAWQFAVRAIPRWNRVSFDTERKIIYLYFNQKVEKGTIYIHETGWPGSKLIQVYAWKRPGTVR